MLGGYSNLVDMFSGRQSSIERKTKVFQIKHTLLKELLDCSFIFDNEIAGFFHHHLQKKLLHHFKIFDM